MIVREVPYLMIAPLESEAVQFVSYVSHIGNMGNPDKLVLRIAMDREKSRSVFCDFPVFIDADKVFKKAEHYMMLRQFDEGQPFVTVQLLHLQVFQKIEDDGCVSYFGKADDFRVIDPEEAKDMLEDLL